MTKADDLRKCRDCWNGMPFGDQAALEDCCKLSDPLNRKCNNRSRSNIAAPWRQIARVTSHLAMVVTIEGKLLHISSDHECVRRPYLQRRARFSRSK